MSHNVLLPLVAVLLRRGPLICLPGDELAVGVRDGTFASSPLQNQALTAVEQNTTAPTSAYFNASIPHPIPDNLLSSLFDDHTSAEVVNTHSALKSVPVIIIMAVAETLMFAAVTVAILVYSTRRHDDLVNDLLMALDVEDDFDRLHAGGKNDDAMDEVWEFYLNNDAKTDEVPEAVVNSKKPKKFATYTDADLAPPFITNSDDTVWNLSSLFDDEKSCDTTEECEVWTDYLAAPETQREYYDLFGDLSDTSTSSSDIMLNLAFDETIEEAWELLRSFDVDVEEDDADFSFASTNTFDEIVFSAELCEFPALPAYYFCEPPIEEELDSEESIEEAWSLLRSFKWPDADPAPLTFITASRSSIWNPVTSTNSDYSDKHFECLCESCLVPTINEPWHLTWLRLDESYENILNSRPHDYDEVVTDFLASFSQEPQETIDDVWRMMLNFEIDDDTWYLDWLGPETRVSNFDVSPHYSLAKIPQLIDEILSMQKTVRWLKTIAVKQPDDETWCQYLPSRTSSLSLQYLPSPVSSTDVFLDKVFDEFIASQKQETMDEVWKMFCSFELEQEEDDDFSDWVMVEKPKHGEESDVWAMIAYVIAEVCGIEKNESKC